MGMGMKSLKWEGIGTKNLFPHTSRYQMLMKEVHFAKRSEQVCVQLLRTLTTWHLPHSSAADAAIDRCLLPAGPAAANLQQRRAAARWDRQTDGHRTVS